MADKNVFTEHYIPTGSVGYAAIRSEREGHGNTIVYAVPIGDSEVTLVAAINPGADGRGLDGHDYNPGSRNIATVVQATSDYLEKTPERQRLIIYEGDPLRIEDYLEDGVDGNRTPASDALDRAVMDRSESGVVQLIAAGHGTEAVSGEPDDSILDNGLLKLFTPDQLLAHRVLRGLTDEVRQAAQENRQVALWGVIWFHAARLKPGQFPELTEAEKAAYMQDPERMRREIIEPVLPYVDGINDAAGRPVLQTGGGTISLSEPYAGMQTDELYESLLQTIWGNGPNESRPLSRLVQAEMTMRDQSIYSIIIQAVRSRKRPFVVYGGSHVESLLPVLRAYQDSTGPE